MLNAYIEHLPELLKAAFARARPRWDTGVTAEMRNATSEVIDIFYRVLVYLADWYPPEHFGERAAQVYFSEFIANRYAWHRALNTPDKPGSGGTIVGVLAGSGALDDVLSAIADMVAVQVRGEFDFNLQHLVASKHGPARQKKRSSIGDCPDQTGDFPANH